MTLRERVKELANSKGLSLPNLESELGFGSGTIVKWEKSTPNVDKLQKVADFFNVSIDYLVTGKNLATKKNETSADGDVTIAIDQVLFELDSNKGEIRYRGEVIDERQESILRNALEIAFDNLKKNKK